MVVTQEIDRVQITTMNTMAKNYRKKRECTTTVQDITCQILQLGLT